MPEGDPFKEHREAIGKVYNQGKLAKEKRIEDLQKAYFTHLTDKMAGEEQQHTTPATDHILRPHHIDLLSIISLTFKDFHKLGRLPAPFLLYIYRFLLEEISEVCSEV